MTHRPIPRPIPLHVLAFAVAGHALALGVLAGTLIADMRTQVEMARTDQVIAEARTLLISLNFVPPQP